MGSEGRKPEDIIKNVLEADARRRGNFERALGEGLDPHTDALAGRLANALDRHGLSIVEQNPPGLPEAPPIRGIRGLFLEYVPTDDEPEAGNGHRKPQTKAAIGGIAAATTVIMPPGASVEPPAVEIVDSTQAAVPIANTVPAQLHDSSLNVLISGPEQTAQAPVFTINVDQKLPTHIKPPKQLLRRNTVIPPGEPPPIDTGNPKLPKTISTERIFDPEDDITGGEKPKYADGGYFTVPKDGITGEELTKLAQRYIPDTKAKVILEHPANDPIQKRADSRGRLLGLNGTMPDDKVLIPGLRDYRVKPGDTLGEISRRLKITTGVLLELNPWLVNPDKLEIDDTILAPHDDKKWVEPKSEKPSPKEPKEKGDEAEKRDKYKELFNKKGYEIKQELQSQALNGESGRLRSDQLDILGSAWGAEQLFPDAAEAFRLLNTAFKDKFGHNLELVDTYRSYDQQVATKKWWEDQGKGYMAATPGRSNHGWGLAIDFGDQDSSTSSVALKFTDEEYGWLIERAHDYGWVNPDWAHDGVGSEEAWHWEYIGRPLSDLLNPQKDDDKKEDGSKENTGKGDKKKDNSGKEKKELGYERKDYYEPGSDDLTDLFRSAAKVANVPASWAESEALHKIVKAESGGWVGIPNYTYGDKKSDRSRWKEVHNELKRGEITARSSASGLGQLILVNVKSYYPSGVDGLGNELEEAVGMMLYVEARYETPEIAWGNHGQNPNRHVGVPVIYTDEGY